jgi:hypothetical protein
VGVAVLCVADEGTAAQVLGRLDARETLIYLRGSARLLVPRLLWAERPDLALTLRLAGGRRVEGAVTRWREHLQGRSVVLTVDRHHASGGLLEQLAAIEGLLDERAELRDQAPCWWSPPLPRRRPL